MSKTTAGIMLVAGLAVVAVGCGVAATGQTVGSPADDWYYDLLSYSGLAIGLVGVGMFFAGSMVFARR